MKRHVWDHDTGLERFIGATNVARYRKLARAETDARERRAIMRQLAKEATKLRTN